MEEDQYKVPAFLRKAELKRKAAKKILYTAWDREQARLQKSSRKTATSSGFKMSQQGVKMKSIREIPPVSDRGSGAGSPYRSISLKVVKQPRQSELPNDQPKIALSYIGNIEDFFEKISVAVIKLKSTLKVGNVIVVGDKAELVESIQINRQPVAIAYSGDDIGIKLKNKAERGAKVFKIEILESSAKVI